jgi:hypothetical protein
MSTHDDPQIMRGAAQPVAHAPPVQLEPGAHAFPQLPQLAGSL